MATHENSMDRGAWQATVYEVAKSQTQLSDFEFTLQFHTFNISHPGKQLLSILPVGFQYLSPISK